MRWWLGGRRSWWGAILVMCEFVLSCRYCEDLWTGLLTMGQTGEDQEDGVADVRHSGRDDTRRRHCGIVVVSEACVSRLLCLISWADVEGGGLLSRNEVNAVTVLGEPK